MSNIDSSHHIPFAAGTSKDGKTVYVDSRIPKMIHMHNGQTVNVHQALHAHETAEKKAMDMGVSYEKAHKFRGIPAENQYLKDHNIDSREYNRTLGPLIRETENKTHNNIPNDLETKPYIETGKLSLLTKR